MKSVRLITALILALIGTCASFPASSDPLGQYSVVSFGAKGDGVTLDTPAINKAIDAASAAGGGTVDFPAGQYLSSSIHLKSNITLFLDQGSSIVAADAKTANGYDSPEDNPAAANYQDFGHTHWRNSLIWGEGLHDVAIEGPGAIVGTGLLRDYFGDTVTANKSISLKLCRNITLRDFSIAHGGWFGILATGVDNLTIDNLKIDTNRDGMDIDCCRNVRIVGCSVNSPNDDGICLKSSFGLGYARATENVTIANCFVSGFVEGSMLDGTYKDGSVAGRRGYSPIGRIKFGTESNGGFINIAITNCVFEHCRGLALETVDGGLLEDVTISNITMRDIYNAPIFLRLGARMRGPTGVPVGELQRINISNITVYNGPKDYSCFISGIDGHPIKDICLSNIQIWSAGGGSVEDVNRKPKEDIAGYPEPDTFGTTPASAFYVRHVVGVTFDNVQVHTTTPDNRPAFVLDDVKGIRTISTDGIPASN